MYETYLYKHITHNSSQKGVVNNTRKCKYTKDDREKKN